MFIANCSQTLYVTKTIISISVPMSVFYKKVLLFNARVTKFNILFDALKTF